MHQTYTTELIVSGLLILVGLLVWRWAGRRG
ncbi:hypothetical protein PQB85_gp71 [Erwinia phage Midgardsormr38]|uniref:Uncharacterized protein n=1 Tax=Erwinia phage Midgardsormr38 TaxID=2663326 RepID=A0A5Q2F5J2_9CAUD|nr:hypothetical protein PQB85_gp71 [Erwinia phage Midgardsormr38]QGF22028.1 hypothetical protein [Erwinia phage Midgardsormr38]